VITWCNLFDSLFLIYRTTEWIQGFDGENDDYPETENDGLLTKDFI
jgi:hypothetical protein